MCHQTCSKCDGDQFQQCTQCIGTRMFFSNSCLCPKGQDQGDHYECQDFEDKISSLQDFIYALQWILLSLMILSFFTKRSIPLTRKLIDVSQTLGLLFYFHEYYDPRSFSTFQIFQMTNLSSLIQNYLANHFYGEKMDKSSSLSYNFLNMYEEEQIPPYKFLINGKSSNFLMNQLQVFVIWLVCLIVFILVGVAISIMKSGKGFCEYIRFNILNFVYIIFYFTFQESILNVFLQFENLKWTQGIHYASYVTMIGYILFSLIIIRSMLVSQNTYPSDPIQRKTQMYRRRDCYHFLFAFEDPLTEIVLQKKSQKTLLSRLEIIISNWIILSLIQKVLMTAVIVYQYNLKVESSMIVIIVIFLFLFLYFMPIKTKIILLFCIMVDVYIIIVMVFDKDILIYILWPGIITLNTLMIVEIVISSKFYDTAQDLSKMERLTQVQNLPTALTERNMNNITFQDPQNKNEQDCSQKGKDNKLEQNIQDKNNKNFNKVYQTDQIPLRKETQGDQSIINNNQNSMIQPNIIQSDQSQILDLSQYQNTQQYQEQSQSNNDFSKKASFKMNETQKQICSQKNISSKVIKSQQNDILIEKLNSINQLDYKQTQYNNIDEYTKGLEQGISLGFPDKIISINNIQIQQQVNQISLENKEIYTDKEFYPCESSLSQNMEQFQRGKGLQWKRVKEFRSQYQKHSDINIFGQDNQISVKDTAQGWLGNCYFVASLTCIAQYPNLVKRLFNQINCNTNKEQCNSNEFQQNFDKNSAYSINLCIDGEWKTTIIDDFLPFKENIKDPIFCKFSQFTKVYWTSLLEKTYAKFKGSYSNIEGGKNKNGSSDAVINFTGAPSQLIRFKNSNKNEVWNTIYEGKKKGFIFTTMMDKEIEASQTDQYQMLDGKVNKNGLISNHAYSILAADVIDENRILKLKNPWGETEWNGKWSDQCNQTWTKRLKELQKLEVAEDGIFWMSFNDYYENFGDLCVSYAHQDYFYSSVSYQNEQQSDKNIITYTIQPLDSQTQGHFILYQNREHLEEYGNNQFVTHLVTINEMTDDGNNIVKQIAKIYKITVKFASTEISLEPNKVYKIVVVTEKPSKLVLAFYTSILIPLSKKQLQFNCSDEILIKQARLSAEKKQINTNHSVYWMSFYCDQDYIVEIQNETKSTLFSQSIKFILTNMSIDPQLKDNEYNTIKVYPQTTNIYIFRRIDQKQPVEFSYSRYEAKFSNA